MTRFKFLLFSFLFVTFSNAFSAEKYDLVISMISRDFYGIQGKYVVIMTRNCNEFANVEPVILFVNGLDKTKLIFSNGITCKVENISNLLQESLED